MGLLDSIINIGSVERTNERNVQAQKDINNANWEQQWKMWQATNEYNSPAAQMQRYKDAGLNPNLIYGQQNTTSAVNVATGKAPNLEAPKANLDDMAFLNFQQQKEVIKGIKADNKIKEIQAQIASDQETIWAAKAFYAQEYEALKASGQLGKNELNLEYMASERTKHLLLDVQIKNEVLKNQYQSIINSFSAEMTKAELGKKLQELALLEEDARQRGLQNDAFWLKTTINTITELTGAFTDVYGTITTKGLLNKRNFQLGETIKNQNNTINTARQYYREQNQKIKGLEKENAWMKRKIYGY